MRLEISASEVDLGPVQHAVEMGPIIVSESKEERVGLAFRGRVLIAVGVEDTALGVDESGGVGVPERPCSLPASTRGAEHRQENDRQETFPKEGSPNAHRLIPLRGGARGS